MIENNYNEKQYRLISNEISYQRLLLNNNGENTNIKYIGNYFDDNKILNLSLNTTDSITNTKNRNLLIDQITLFSTNPNISNYLPLQFDLNGKKLYFIASGDTSEINEYDILYNKLGLYDNLKNAEFNKFELMATSIPVEEVSAIANANSTQIIHLLDSNNDIKIFISIKSGNAVNNYIYYGLLKDIKNNLPMTKITMDTVLTGRFKTNGFNVLIGNLALNDYLYDVRNNTNLIFIRALTATRWIAYQTAFINNNYFSYALCSDVKSDNTTINRLTLLYKKVKP